MVIPARNQKVRGLAEPRPLTLKVAWGLAYEGLIGLSLFAGNGHESTFDVGSGWFEKVRVKGSDELRADARRLLHKDGHIVVGLAGLADAAGGRDLARLAELARADKAGDVKRALLDNSHAKHIEKLDPRELALAVADLLDRWNQEVWSELGPPLERDLKASAQAVKRLAGQMSPDRAIVKATRGVEYRQEPWIHTVTLVPSVLNRPWVDIDEWQGVKYFFYPASTETTAPDAELVEVYKALGDETRLKILRLLANDVTSLTEIAEALGLAKSTVSQHMVVLRQAGLTRSLVGEERKGYRLGDRPDLNALLEGYLKT